MNKTAQFSVIARCKSIHYAVQGIVFMLKTQHNAWVHCIATLGVIIFAHYLQISANDWRWLIVAIIMVWIAEAFNTAVEYVCDVVSPQYSEAVKRAKDIAAGAVLLAAIGAIGIGGLTFWTYLV